jgi:hypothetical protein
MSVRLLARAAEQGRSWVLRDFYALDGGEARRVDHGGIAISDQTVDKDSRFKSANDRVRQHRF